MPSVYQSLRILSSKRKKIKKGIFISKHSVGTIFINGKPLTYNADLVYKDEDDITWQRIQEDYDRRHGKNRKRVIVIRRR